MDIVNFFHRLMNPHCPHCQLEEDTRYERARELKVCDACEILKIENERLHRLIDRLTSPKIIEPTQPVNEEVRPIPTGRKFVPMAVRQQMQDALDRRTLDLLVASKIRTEPVIEEAVTTDNKVEEMERDILAAPVLPEVKEVNG